jgi:hypothetical protein
LAFVDMTFVDLIVGGGRRDGAGRYVAYRPAVKIQANPTNDRIAPMMTIAPISQIKLFIVYLLRGDLVAGVAPVTGSPGRRCVSADRR